MSDLIVSSAFFGSVLSLAAYFIGVWMKNRFRLAIFNPILIAVLLCIAALCVLAPAALAAQPLDESENDGRVIVYFDACGGTGIPGVERTNADGKLSSLPTPTMEGYTFNGWTSAQTINIVGRPFDVAQIWNNAWATGCEAKIVWEYKEA